MNIKRSTPDVGYIAPELFASMRVSQIVRAGNNVHLSGVVPSSGEGMTVTPDNPAEQIAFVIKMIAAMLETEGMDHRNIVSVTIYTTDIAKVYAHFELFSEYFADSPPCVTTLGVDHLSTPEILLEVVVIAADLDAE